MSITSLFFKKVVATFRFASYKEMQEENQKNYTRIKREAQSRKNCGRKKKLLTEAGVELTDEEIEKVVGGANTRMESGLRINSAKDDYAGLQISDRMTAEIKGL